jgi:hypothetical protein
VQVKLVAFGLAHQGGDERCGAASDAAFAWLI